MLNDPNWDKKVEIELDKVSQHILRAADWLETHTWIQRRLFGPNEESACTLGALVKVDPVRIVGSVLGTKDIYAAGERIRKHLKIGLIGSWNDAPERTKEQVISTLRTIAYSGGK